MKKNKKEIRTSKGKKAKKVKGVFFTDKTSLNLIVLQKEFFCKIIVQCDDI